VALVGTAAASPRAEVAVDPARQAHDIAQALMSPFCPGLTLAVCRSAGAAALREELRRRLAEGEPKDAVLADFEARFGSQITGVPGNQGFERLAWLLPPAGGLGIFLLVCVMVSRRSATDDDDGDVAPADAATLARVDEELLQLDI
jgi:cytochrome c-type biogenesis protein CcmH/NrfF